MTNDEKLKALTDAFIADAEKSRTKPPFQKGAPLHKRIHEVDVDKNYGGEASAYWEHVHETHDPTGEGMSVLEDPLSNPDVLSEDDALYDRPLTVEGEIMLRAVDETMHELTPQQQQIVQLSKDGVWSEKDGQRLYTEQAIAAELKITRDNVHMTLSRIKTKIRRRYEKLKTAKE